MMKNNIIALAVCLFAYFATVCETMTLPHSTPLTTTKWVQ